MKFKEKPHKARKIYKRKSSGSKFSFSGRTKYVTPISPVTGLKINPLKIILETMGFNVKH